MRCIFHHSNIRCSMIDFLAIFPSHKMIPEARLMPAFNFLILQIHLLFLCSPWEATDADCFYPDGKLATGDLPCDSSQSQSFCCGPGWTCLDNKLCHSTGEYTKPDQVGYARGSCTDSMWKSDQCPQFCTGSQGAYDDSMLIF